MPWVVLLLSSILEAVWANALSASDSFTKLGPTILFACAVVPSMFGLSYATKTIPMSTAYASWAGLGAVFTVAWAMLTGAEAVSTLKLLCLAGIIIGIVGLKMLKPHTPVASHKEPLT